VFDGRNGSDAMQYGVCMKRAVDIQVLWSLTKIPNRSHASNHFVKGLLGCVEDAGLLSNSDRRDLENVQSRGEKLFLPESGGRYDVWKQRLLNIELVEYCASDVTLLFKLKQKWTTDKLNGLVFERTEKRIRDAIHGVQVAQGRERARVDFSLEVPRAASVSTGVPSNRRSARCNPPRMHIVHEDSSESSQCPNDYQEYYSPID